MLLGRDPVLRRHAEAVPSGTDVHALAEQMRQAMHAHDGVGIAAPQIGKSIQMFVIATNLLPEEEQLLLTTDTFINPTLTTRGFKREILEEGCLSIPGVFGDVSRIARVQLRAYDLDWNRINISADGLLARVFLHEVDHLRSTLFVDKAKKDTLHKFLEDQTSRPWKSNEVEPS